MERAVLLWCTMLAFFGDDDFCNLLYVSAFLWCIYTVYRLCIYPFCKIPWQMPLPLLSWFLTFFTLHTWCGQVLSLSESLSLTLSEQSTKQNTKRPSALLTEKVQRRASLLGTEIAAMLLLDHAEPQPVHPSTTNSHAVCDWLLAPIQRGDPASPRMQHRKLPHLAHNTQRHGLSRHTVSLTIGFSWLKTQAA